VITLGFDTATHATAVGLRLADGRALRARDDPAPEEHPGHATRLLAMADELLRQAGIGWSALDRVAVGVGPGRFTGLRVGIATARGLAQALSIELVGVSSLRVLAEAALQSAAAPGEGVLAVIDARRGEAFAAAYAPAGAAGAREVGCERPLHPHELSAVFAMARDEGVACERWQAVGDGALRFREHLEAAGASVPPEGSQLHRPDGAVVCELAGRLAPARRLEEVVPDYRRRPDAEREPSQGGERGREASIEKAPA
jgi:tRNA threonylcarbamoyladenosine biosynthesis protein TsaB